MRPIAFMNIAATLVFSGVLVATLARSAPLSASAEPAAPAAPVAPSPAPAEPQAPPTAPAEGMWSAADCQTCHDTAVGSKFARTKHAGLQNSCASCHTNVAEHYTSQLAGETDGPIPSMKKLSANEINTTCLTCHEKANQANYDSSAHARRNVACTTCHSVHTPKSVTAQLKTRTDAETCATCHQSVRSQMQKTSHHPVREGKMSCSSCHNPHDGARPKMLKADSTNELCYTCHTEKRGPFLFEHAPVREDCSSCHTPHGSNHRRMLTQKLPNLCYSCHMSGSGHFGSGDNLSTAQGVRVAPAGAPAGYPTVNSRFIGKSCKNCHVNLHGSNSPSGAYFVR